MCKSVCNRKKIQNTLSPGAVAQVQGWEIAAGAESAKMLAQTSAGGSEQSPDTAWKNLFGDAHPACQPALTAVAKSAKISTMLQEAAFNCF